MQRTCAWLVAGLLGMTLAWPALSGGKTPRLEPGLYEGLMLAVAADGDVTGYFLEEQGQGVTKRCSFFLAGKAASGEAPIVTWNQQTFAGTLAAEDEGVRLKIEKGREHPGCGLVLLPEISSGVSLDRVARGQWLQLLRVRSGRAYFHESPDTSKKRQAYVIEGDVVGTLSEQEGWFEVEYLARKRRIRGWIPASDVERLRPPAR